MNWKLLGKISLALLAAGLILAAIALYLLAWPWRMAARVAGITRPPRGGKAATVAIVEATLALLLSAFGLRRSSRQAPEPSRPRYPLRDEEIERERLIGLRQGQAAGIRSAARKEAHDEARRLAIREVADRFAGEMRSDSLRTAGVTRDGE